MIPAAAVILAALQAAVLEAFARATGTEIIATQFFGKLDIAHAPFGCRFSPASPTGMTDGA